MTEEYSPYPVCIDISNTDERPEHKNWVVPSGTNILVDFNTVINHHIASILREVEEKVIRKDEAIKDVKNRSILDAPKVKVQNLYRVDRNVLRATQRQALKEIAERYQK